jgi:dihydroflavonol-4-reductase
MKLFITGGTSSIGRVLVQEMARRGTEARVLVRANSRRDGLEQPGVEFVQGDVTDLHAVRLGMAGCDGVVHMAAIVAQNVPETEWWRVNRDGARNVLQAAYDQGATRMVQISSLAVLGYTQPGETADETRPIDTSLYLNLYQKTKHAADELAREYAARGLAVAIVYPGFGFGCSRASSHPSLQDQTLLRMAAGKPAAIMGSGKNHLLLAYYKDTVQGISRALEVGQAGEGYILGNQSMTFVEMWAEIARLLGKRAPWVRIPTGLLRLVSQASRTITGRSPFPPDFFDMISKNWSFSNARACRELGIQPKSFREALAETWQDYQKNP